MKLNSSYTLNIEYMNDQLSIDENFDICSRTLLVGYKNCTFYFVDGFVKDDIFSWITQYLLKLDFDEFPMRLNEFEKQHIPYTEVDVLDDYEKIIKNILSGSVVCFIDGYDYALSIDMRTYPNRAMSEPEDDRVLRGSRDSFVETLVFNTALIRRRIRDKDLKMKLFEIGSKSKTDVVMCYLQDCVELKLVDEMENLLSSISIPSLSMSQESLAECLIKKQWWNPFPRIRYTERCDVASANLYEGKIIILVDNSPAIMILPTSFFDYFKEANDFYFPPLIGTYLRWLRILVFGCALFLTPLWYLFIQNIHLMPSFLHFLAIDEMNQVPLILQILLVEFLVDTIKLASLNTPSSLSGSFGVIGALVLGEFAVKAHLFVPEILLIMAFVSIANFTQPSYELSYAFKLWRIFLVLCISLLNVLGFILGLLLMMVVLFFTSTILSQHYLYPLFPFDLKKIKELFIRVPIDSNNS